MNLTGITIFIIGELNRLPSRQFSLLFNAYAQAFNKQKNRHGSLFEKSFRRKKIKDEKYIKNLILYIHNNSVQHEFTNRIESYPWTSFHSIISTKKTKLQRKDVLQWFENKANFIATHRQKVDTIFLEKWLKL